MLQDNSSVLNQDQSQQPGGQQRFYQQQQQPTVTSIGKAGAHTTLRIPPSTRTIRRPSTIHAVTVTVEITDTTPLGKQAGIVSGRPRNPTGILHTQI